MVNREKWACRREMGVGKGSLLALMVGIVTSFSLYAAGDDDYLKALSQEADKVGQPISPSAAERGGGGGEASRAEFEQELKEKYAGSAAFYRKLPASSQEEIYLEYRAGATISELRKKSWIAFFTVELKKSNKLFNFG